MSDYEINEMLDSLDEFDGYDDLKPWELKNCDEWY